ncbi:MAG: hypothetical protein KDK24_17770 [Pseudooceanicola sp.]|nr:hypothetical protein [Pseudooceanicola sp.]
MRHLTGLLLIPMTVLPACDARNLYIAHQTVLGINASVDQGRQQGQLVIGYDRDFATVIPKTVDAGPNGEKNVMALFNCTALEIDGIHLNRYSDVTVTGDVAVGKADPKSFACDQK